MKFDRILNYIRNNYEKSSFWVFVFIIPLVMISLQFFRSIFNIKSTLILSVASGLVGGAILGTLVSLIFMSLKNEQELKLAFKRVSIGSTIIIVILYAILIYTVKISS